MPDVDAFLAALRTRPVIAAIRADKDVGRAAQADVAAVFLLGGSILTLPDAVRRIQHGGRRAFVHLDLCAGLGRDEAAVAWCARVARADGLITTRSPLIRAATEAGLLTIQRMFLMDSSSFAHGIRLIRANPPDLVEVLPGLAPKAIERLRAALPVPVIAGGMVTEREEARLALEAGAVAVSTSEERLWSV